MIKSKKSASLISIITFCSLTLDWMGQLKRILVSLDNTASELLMVFIIFFYLHLRPSNGKDMKFGLV
jgi:hypothetical protein